MINSPGRPRLALALTTLCTLAACIDPGATVESATEQGVYHGTVIGDTWANLRGLVKVGYGEGCSGVLLSNDLVLTAGHCLGLPGAGVYPLDFGGQLRLSDRVYRFGDGGSAIDNEGFYSATADLAMLRASSPFSVGGSTTGFSQIIEPSTAAELVGRHLQVYGQGFDDAVPGPDGRSGTWRTGVMRVVTASSHTDDLYAMHPTDNAQGIRPGDSGGPSFVEDEDGARLVGIHLRAAQEACAPNAGTCIAHDLLIYPDLWGITLAMEHDWNPLHTTEVFDAWSAELRVARQPDGDINTLPWTQLARLASTLCTNRMLPGGHATGHQQYEKRGLACSGTYAAVAMDVRADAVIPLGVYDLDQTEWAVAQRAAMTLCRQVARASSGFFSGYSRRGDSYGLVCLTAGVSNLTASWKQLAATGWRVDGVVQTEYAQALRAANGFCVARGFATGYLTGGQSRDLYSVTCQAR